MFRNHKVLEEEKIIRERCIKFVVCIITDLQHQIPDNVKILQKVSMFSVKNVLKVVRDPVADLLQILNVPESNISKIEI